MTDPTPGGTSASKTYTLPFPAGFNPMVDDAGLVHDFLVSKGVAVDWVSITKTNILVHAGSDPTSAMAIYQPKVDQRATLKASLAAIDVANADNTTLRTAVNILKQLVEMDV